MTTEENTQLKVFEQEIVDSIPMDRQDEVRDLLKEFEQASHSQKRTAVVAKILDWWLIPLDWLIGLLPWLGDAGPRLLLSWYYLFEISKVKLSWRDKAKIFAYNAIDATVPMIPIFGDIFDFFRKADQRTADIFEKHLQQLKKKLRQKNVDEQTIQDITNKTWKVAAKIAAKMGR